ncbi:MAG TPA: hypothetical protein VLC08_13800 [Chitinolyticbacter sp.]|nr:hypothetical protein [Chitinolyticbacter sp.]
MREFLIEYVIGYCILGTLLGSLAYLYLCVRLYDTFQRHYPKLVDEILGAMDSNIGQEFRALTVMPPLLRSAYIAELPSQRHRFWCRATRVLGYGWIACLVMVFVPFFL